VSFTALSSIFVQVNYEALKGHAGIRAVVFDKDNTLTAPYENRVHQSAKSGLEQALNTFGRENVAVLSNSAGTSDDPGYADAQQIEENLGIAVIRHTEKKPGGMKEVLEHFGLSDPASICVVGDRILTDVVFGNVNGMLTVHTAPCCSGVDNTNDNWMAKLLRPAENKILYGNWFGGRKLRKRRIQHKFWPGEEAAPLTQQQCSDVED